MKKVILLCLLISGWFTSVHASFIPFDDPFPQDDIKASSPVPIKSPSSTLTVPVFFAIRAYQVLISSQDGPNCIYSPTCSAYGYASFSRYGLFWGVLMTSDRWLRCNPFGEGGNDNPADNYWFKK